jgi:hypothetical protein
MSKDKQPIKLDIEVPDDYEAIKKLAESDVNFVVRKDITYGGSWRKRGGVGAFMMLARKIDRIENFAKNHDKQYDIFDLILTAEDPEDILDDLTDLRCYLLLVESYVRGQLQTSEHPDVKKSVELRQLVGECNAILAGIPKNFCDHVWDFIKAPDGVMATDYLTHRVCRKCGAIG